MYIVHIASELAPIAKVGGLADVLLGLCRELSWKKHDVDIIIPKYDCMDADDVRDLSIEIPNLRSFYQGEWHQNSIWVGWVENLKVYFIEPHHPRFFFNRGCFYGCIDDVERFLYFNLCALEFLSQKSPQPDIMHLHDWQTAAIGPLYNQIYRPYGFNRPSTVFTIHNIEYQGRCAPFDLDRVGLRGKEVYENLKDPLFPDALNLLKGGIVYADAVTTVSPNYAWEVTTPEGGKGLDKTLLQYKDKFQGVLNGIDYSFWNPEIDRYLPAHFSFREVPVNKADRITIDKKAYLKKVLREKFELSGEHKPIVGCIARLVPQKGIELIKHALFRTLENKGQFVLLGSSPIPAITEEFHELKTRFQDHPDVHLFLHHQEDLAHLIFAGSDIFIVPSLFEPCGLTQMIALKYGAIPVVRKTGGLADTIFDVDYSGKPFEATNGYVFEYPDNIGLDSALDRAMKTWFDEPEKWRKLMIQGMKIDFSWNKSSDKYLDVYNKIRKKN